ncbi:tRNA guanosine(34) transglycosylase Tgt [Candidatus Pacearchaeota archaeon CG10_big_fil_rev_8_21_14_0_10_31_24]|nr:MAG: tRNA guanosine(34) transglycosylase Tgt [Candidatus Pacearchaeota archaeon CG10_big_fil_rev_8_21_14_0_10_31_24]
MFKILAKDKKTQARTGILKTKSGEIETPFFMPVATKTAVKYLSSKDLEDMGAKAIISNAFILSLKPGTNIIKKMGGIKKFMNYNGINFTDSGGFQMYSPSLYLGSKENGVMFRNPFNGEKLFITPEEDMKIQLDIDSDVAMCLDTMPLIEHSKKSIIDAVNKTTAWAEKCKIHHEKLQKNIPEEKRQILFGIIQGGIHPDLREKSAKELLKLNFKGYSIGGLALGEPKKDEYKMVKIVKSIIPEEKPIYLMGIGNPSELLEAISLGVDMFDSRFPTQNARHGTLFTKKGYMRVINSKYKTDSKPIDPECECFTCKNHTKAFIHHMIKMDEGNGMRLVTYHNLYFLQWLMKESRSQIKNGTFSKFKKQMQTYFER